MISGADSYITSWEGWAACIHSYSSVSTLFTSSCPLSTLVFNIPVTVSEWLQWLALSATDCWEVLVRTGFESWWQCWWCTRPCLISDYVAGRLSELGTTCCSLGVQHMSTEVQYESSNSLNCLISCGWLASIGRVTV
jgi:hypothetical protein